jgi:quercetin dioxygenase-like cupin family protein
MIEHLESLGGDAAAELRRRGLAPNPWSAGPDARFAPHEHARPKRLYVVRGSIAFDGMELHTGEGILVPAGWTHSAVAGSDGVECVEAFE